MSNPNLENSQVGNVSTANDGSIATGQEKEKYRAVISISKEDKYFSDENPAGWTPYANEIFVDQNGIISIWGKDEAGRNVKISKMKEMYDIIVNLKNLGILQNAESFRLNGKIYNFLFNNDKMVLRLNTELDIYSQYKYYSVRKIERNEETGDYIYITGITETSEDGVIKTISHMANITYIDGRYVPAPARMVNPCSDGERYIVDFYDAARTPVGSQVFYARAVTTLDYSLSPEMAIRDLVVTTDRPYEDGCFLYQNEDPNNLIIRVGVNYADGSTIDVTEEGQTTGRLIFEGRDKIDTTTLTSSAADAQEINVSYYISQDNSQPIDRNDLQTLLLDSNTICMTKPLKVYIKEDIFDPIIDVTMHGYKEVAYAEGVTDIFKIKVYAHYKSGCMRDITPVMDGNRFITTANFKYNAETGCMESTKILSQFVVQLKLPQGRSTALFNKIFNCEFVEYNRRMAINQTEGGFDPQDAAKMTLFNSTQNKMRLSETDILTSLRETYAYKYELEKEDYLIPTHVLVRHGLNPNVIYSGYSLADSYSPLDNENGIINYIIPQNNLITEDMPLLIEFYQITTDDETGARTNIQLCKMQRTYAKVTTQTL